jgi:hypothetical protein
MISDLQAMTETQLKALSQAQLVDYVLQERTTSKVIRQIGDSRGMLDYEIEHYDYKGKLTGSERTLTTYKPDKSVDVITKISKDAAGKEAKRVEIAHDGTKAWVKSTSETPIKRLAVSKAVEVEPIAEAVPKRGILQTIKAKVLGLIGR